MFAEARPPETADSRRHHSRKVAGQRRFLLHRPRRGHYGTGLLYDQDALDAIQNLPPLATLLPCSPSFIPASYFTASRAACWTFVTRRPAPPATPLTMLPANFAPSAKRNSPRLPANIPARSARCPSRLARPAPIAKGGALRPFNLSCALACSRIPSNRLSIARSTSTAGHSQNSSPSAWRRTRRCAICWLALTVLLPFRFTGNASGSAATTSRTFWLAALRGLR